MKGVIYALKQNAYGNTTFGDIQSEDGEYYFFHKNYLIGCKISDFQIGTPVLFYIRKSQTRPDSSEAYDVRMSSESPTETNAGQKDSVASSISEMERGIIAQLKRHDNGFAYGGQINTETGKSYFFHKSAITNGNIRSMHEGDQVEFQLGTYEGRLQALKVRQLTQADIRANIAKPGINPQVSISHLLHDERDILHLFSKVFYVTSGGREFDIGRSTYRYFLVKPTEYFIDTFQLSRELAVVFDDYVSFEPRALDAAGYVYRTIDSKLRLDRGCSILVCRDNSVEEKLSTLLRDSNLDQIVIPFTIDELLSSTQVETLIRDRFRKYLFDTDLFATFKPIENEIFFFGRRDLILDIVSKCKNNTNCGVFGLRRSGKTSVLYAVRRLLNQESYSTVFIPCESDLSSINWRKALYKLVTNVYNALGIDKLRIQEDAYASDDTVLYFDDDLHYALVQSPKPVTLMFDEIEAITFSVIQGEESDNLWIDGSNFVYFWNAVKGYYSKYPNQLTILIAGTNPMINEVPAIGKSNTPNPMYRQLSDSNQGAYLQSFTGEDTKNMVNTLGAYMGLTFDEYSIAKLTSDCGGHPYLMRIMCSYINKFARANNLERPLIVKKPIYDKATLEFEKSSEAEGFFWMVLNILMTSYPREFNTLKILALQGDEIVSQIQDKDALFHLIGYGLVECNQGSYAIKFTTIQNFLRGEYQFERVGLNIEDQKQEIQLRLNSAEMKLRKVVKNTLRSIAGKKAKDIVLNAMKKHPATQNDVACAQSLTYDQLFDASINKMYFSLLQTIVINNLPYFTNVFEDCSPRDIDRHLQVINYSRRCPDHSFTADAEKWSWQKFLDFRESISWLEGVLDQYE